MASYTKRPATNDERADAAVYRFGEPLDEVLEVAKLAHRDVEVVEVPQWRVLLIRHTEVPDHAPPYKDYDVMEEGQLLVYEAGVMYAEDRERFLRMWEPVVGPAEWRRGSV